MELPWQRGKQSPAEKLLFYLVWFLRIDIFAAIIWMLILGNWEAFFISILALVISFAPELLKSRYNLKLPVDYIFIMVFFIYLSIFLGSGLDWYERFVWWDDFLHVGSGIVLAFVGFLILYTLQQLKKLKASPFIFAMFAFMFGLALGAVWEIFEFGMDEIFGTNMQRNGLNDTMWDLIIDALGSLLTALFLYDFLANNRKDGFVYTLVQRFFKANPKLKKAKWL